MAASCWPSLIRGHVMYSLTQEDMEELTARIFLLWGNSGNHLTSKLAHNYNFLK